MAAERSERPEVAAFAYGRSRSGKTTYLSPLVLREDLEAEDTEHAEAEDLAMGQGFLFLPSPADPAGTLNAPHPVHRARLRPLAHMDWTLWEQSHPSLERLLRNYTWELHAAAEAAHEAIVSP